MTIRLTDPFKGLEEVLPVHIVKKDVLPAITTAHDVVNGSGILHSQWAGHGGTLAKTRPNVQLNIAPR
jgi:hypothetical protein